MADRMPLVHFPARTPFRIWANWPAQAVIPRSLLPDSRPPKTATARVCHEHLFAYAGPCCYGPESPKGDSALYFSPGVEAGADGHATPFDSGALLEAPARLMPFGKRSASRRLAFLALQSVRLEGWRTAFAAWLQVCYAAPVRYLDTSGSHYRDGLPDRTLPPELRDHNGIDGMRMYERVADRRAWTWEVRSKRPFPFVAASMLHVPFDALQGAVELQARLRLFGSRIDVHTLPPGVSGSAQSLYRHSGSLLEELTQ
jgi:hypothetical protein